ncbi:hypothetical protein B7463_g7405, partial [Scytalidium lignicola]
MDIDDILREVDRSRFDVDLVEHSRREAQADLRALTRAWINERGAPELLPWPADGLIPRVTARIKQQIDKVEEMTGDMDPKTNFGLIIVQTELERWKYLIDAHILHYLSSPELSSRMSETEIAYATRHQALLHSHYLSSFLVSFPQQLQNLNDTAGGISMVTGPDEESGVFVRGVAENLLVSARGRDADGEVEVRRGEVVIARWADVRPYVERDEGVKDFNVSKSSHTTPGEIGARRGSYPPYKQHRDYKDRTTNPAQTPNLSG